MKLIRRYRLVLGILPILVAGVGIWLFWQRPSVPLTPLRVGTIAEYSTLVRVAEQEGFFAQNGLNVSMTEFGSGMSAMQGLLGDSVDITLAADFVGTRHSFETQDFRILASVFESTHAFELVARKDSAIERPGDLRKKTIGVTRKTMGEYFLGTFLEWHDLSLRDVTIVDGEPTELAAALEHGSVDAVVTFNPHTHIIAKTLAPNSVTFDVQHNTPLFALVYARPSFLREHSDVAEQFVRSLVEAEEHAAQNPGKMKEFFRREFHYSDEYADKVLSHASFSVSLRQSMLLSMENQARWIIENQLASGASVNFLELVSLDTLDAVKPEAISIIR